MKWNWTGSSGLWDFSTVVVPATGAQSSLCTVPTHKWNDKSGGALWQTAQLTYWVNDYDCARAQLTARLELIGHSTLFTLTQHLHLPIITAMLPLNLNDIFSPVGAERSPVNILHTGKSWHYYSSTRWSHIHVLQICLARHVNSGVSGKKREGREWSPSDQKLSTSFPAQSFSLRLGIKKKKKKKTSEINLDSTLSQSAVIICGDLQWRS